MNTKRLLLLLGLSGLGSLLIASSLIHQQHRVPRANQRQQQHPIRSSRKNNNKKENLNEIMCADIPDDCDLSNATYGVPTILLSQGRSGSSSTWQLLESLGVGNDNALVLGATEPAGSNEKQALAFMDQQEDSNEHGKCWLERYMCRKQRLNRKTQQRGNGVAANRIYGFKWKPWKKALDRQHSRQALEWLSQNPHIKVIRNRRNVLDVTASILKHDYYPVKANHCLAGDTACVESHLHVKINRPLSEWMGLLQEIEENQVFADELLEQYHVAHVNVSYEKLYHGDTATEWIRLLRFLGIAPLSVSSLDSLTVQDVQSHMEHAATSLKDRRQQIANYGKLAAALRNTQFEKYLDPTRPVQQR